MNARLFSALAALSLVLGSATGAAAAPQPPELDVPVEGWLTDFTVADVPLVEIQASVPRDAIPPIDEPRFESPTEAWTWMDGRAPVIALEVEGDARAYPLAILLWHEIVNDVVGGQPMVITFCPLCHTALVYDRTLAGTVHQFGNTGSLRYSDMVMYDRATESWWQQATGRAIIGELTGAGLEFLPAQILSLAAFEETYPDGLVLSRDTGHERPYGDNPFLGYGDANERPFRFDGAIDGWLSPKERVITVGGPGDDPLAFSYFDLAGAGVVATEQAGQPVVVLWTPGTADSFDGPVVGYGADIGSAGVFSPVVDGRALTFERATDGRTIRDVDTGSSWSAAGLAMDGPLLGTRLDRVLSGDHFWFSWAAFTPETRVWQPPDGGGKSAD